jgi:hypothetical protein
MSDDLFMAPQRDDFSHESPIRAFTDWREKGRYAIGKGFRPSVQHLAPYLDAMERKENWQTVQVLDAGNGLTILFRRAGVKIMPEPSSEVEGEPIVIPMMFTLRGYDKAQIYELMSRCAGDIYEVLIGEGKELDDLDLPPGWSFLEWRNGRTAVFTRVRDAVYEPTDVPAADDPVNPKHYAGTACAEIGELLSANSYQVLKYIWRLGEKDDPVVELGKALWYLDRERKLYPSGCNNISTKIERSFVLSRLQNKSDHVGHVVSWLVSWHHYGKRETLKLLEDYLTTMKENIEAEREANPVVTIDLGRQQEP